MKRAASLLLACLLVAACGDRPAEPSRLYDPPELF